MTPKQTGVTITLPPHVPNIPKRNQVHEAVDYRDLGRRLLATPGVTLHFGAEMDIGDDTFGLMRDGTHFVSVELNDPRAQTFTHYLRYDGDDLDVDGDISYYNSEAWGEETRTLGEQQALVRGRFRQWSVGLRTGPSILHSTAHQVLAVAMTTGDVFAYADGVPGVVFATPKDGWETPLNWYIDQAKLDRKQVLREILAFVGELPENITARVAVLGTNIQEILGEGCV